MDGKDGSKKEEDQDTIHFCLLNNPPFRDDPVEVMEVDMKWGEK